jgi:hypothetical protein
VWRSLGTKDPRKARQLAHEKLALLHAGWALTRQRIANSISGASVLSDDDLHRIAIRFYQEEITQDDRHRARLPTGNDIDGAKAELIASPAFNGIQKLPERDLPIAALDASMDFLILRDTAKSDAARRRSQGPAELSVAQATRFFEGCSEKTKRVIGAMVEGDREFRFSALKQSLNMSTAELSGGVWSGITKRTRTILGDRKARLITWGQNEYENGVWQDAVGTMSETTYKSFRKLLGM